MTTMTAYGTCASLGGDSACRRFISCNAVTAHAALRAVRPMLGEPNTLIGASLDATGRDGVLVAYTNWQREHENLVNDTGCIPPECREHIPAFEFSASRAAHRTGSAWWRREWRSGP